MIYDRESFLVQFISNSIANGAYEARIISSFYCFNVIHEYSNAQYVSVVVFLYIYAADTRSAKCLFRFALHHFLDFFLVPVHGNIKSFTHRSIPRVASNGDTCRIVDLTPIPVLGRVHQANVLRASFRHHRTTRSEGTVNETMLPGAPTSFMPRATSTSAAFGHSLQKSMEDPIGCVQQVVGHCLG